MTSPAKPFRKTKQVREIIEIAISRAEQAEEYRNMLQKIKKFCMTYYGEVADSDLTMALYRAEADARRMAMQFGLALPAEDQERIRAMAHVATGRVMPPSWLDMSSVEWEAACDEAFLPQRVKDMIKAANVAQRLEGGPNHGV